MQIAIHARISKNGHIGKGFVASLSRMHCMRQWLGIPCLLSLLFLAASGYAKSPEVTEMPLTWLVPVMHKSFNLSVHTYRDQLLATVDDYTPNGWGQYSRIVKNQRIFEKIEGYKTSSDLRILSDPRIISQGRRDNTDAWEAELAVTLSYNQKEVPDDLRGVLKVTLIKAAGEGNVHSYVIDSIAFTPQK